MLESGQQYYCSTERDVDLLMTLFEKNQYKWCSGKNPRAIYQDSPIIYYIENERAFHCSYPPFKKDIEESIHVDKIRNKIISELRR